MRRRIFWFVSLALLAAALAISHYLYSARLGLATVPLSSPEQPVISIEISGPLANRNSEVSGLDWYADYLIILPQYPERLSNHLFALRKADILGALSTQQSTPLEPIPIPFFAPDFANEIEGFEGFEAIAFQGSQVFLTIEAKSNGFAKGYIVTGTIANDLSLLTIDSQRLVESPAQSTSPNKADESLIVTENQIIAIYEANGMRLNSSPSMHAFDFELRPQPPVSFPNIEYRITDATALDEQSRFWAVNYFYPGDQDLLPDKDPLAIRYGRGHTHRQQPTVERLVEFSYSQSDITQTHAAPIQLELAIAARNWEGIVRLDNQGFLLMTDKFPETILGFVAQP